MCLDSKSSIEINASPETEQIIRLGKLTTQNSSLHHFRAVFLKHRAAARIPGPGINYTGPSSYKKRIYRVAVSLRLRSTVLEFP
jgi:hypothetical protein